MPLKKKARKVRHVDEVIDLKHGHRQCQERDRSPDGASGVGTFTEIVKWAMSLEENFKCNPNSKEDEKKPEPSNYQHVDGRGQNSKKGLFKRSSNWGHYNGQGKGSSPQFGKKWSCTHCGNAQLPRAQVPIPHPNLLRVVMMGKGCRVDCTP
nr:hypothetical protein CFP56_64407 [Quercus suber]